MRVSRFAGLLGAILLAACAGEYPQSSIAPTTDFADRIQDLYFQIFLWSMGILAVVWIVLAWILVRFRERPDGPEPQQIHGHLGFEIAWTIVPALIVVAIAIPTIQATFDTQTPDPDAMVVDVIGHQYWWEFRYPEIGEYRTANELHLPVGQPIALRIWSTDVIHSFWVPQLGGKRDANPLRAVPSGEERKYNWIFMTPRETGVFMGQCAEFCGPSHSLMGMRVVVETPEEFEAWIAAWDAGHGEPAAADPRAALIELGRETFQSGLGGCIACHAIEGTNAQGAVGPNLTLLGRRSMIAAGWLENTEENLVRWITAPQDVKPGALMPGVNDTGGGFPATNFTEEQVRAVAAYLSSLR
ncbi:MAG: cytochrome c oxidase subunit II [Longimicrobiales bacterium]|nr:cytochrome c oxidase subunit II [Longimicrobiales bacterium]